MKYASNFGKPSRIAKEITIPTSHLLPRVSHLSPLTSHLSPLTPLYGLFPAIPLPSESKPLAQIDCEWDG